jgi:hypothetical protein
MWREVHQLELKYEFIAKQFLEGYYDDEQKHLDHAIKGTQPADIINENRIAEKMAEKLDLHTTVITSKIKNFINQVHRSKSLNSMIPFEKN